MIFFFFFFNDTATTEIYTLSLHDALPIFRPYPANTSGSLSKSLDGTRVESLRSEEHTSELQSHLNLVCRLLLEKKKKQITTQVIIRTRLIDKNRVHVRVKRTRETII